MMPLLVRPLLAGIVILGLAATPALAQIESREGIALQNQIAELRHDLQTLRDQIGRGGGGSMLGAARQTAPVTSGGPNDITASLVDRVARLEEEMRTLRGRIDEAENAHQQRLADLGKKIDDLNFRLDNAGGAAPAVARPAAPAPTISPPVSNPGAQAAAAAPAAPVRRTPELALQEGNAALARRDYATAEASAREVLANPRSTRAIDAQFLLAEALAGKRDYSSAAVAYDDAYNRSRVGVHAQDSLLGLANSLTAIGEKRAACATLDKLKAEFPSPRQDLREPIASSRDRAGCH